jgi:hypothetical protein
MTMRAGSNSPLSSSRLAKIDPLPKTAPAFETKGLRGGIGRRCGFKIH